MRIGLAVVLLLLNGAVLAADALQVEQVRETTSNLIRLLVEQGILTPEKAQALVDEAQKKAKLLMEEKVRQQQAAEQEAAARRATAGESAPTAQDATATPAPAPAGRRTKPAQPRSAPAENVVRVPYVPETVKREIREQIKEEVLAQAKAERWGEPGAVPEWIENLKWEGDLRLRIDRTLFANGNTPDFVLRSQGVNISNSTIDRDRLRIRARLAMSARINDAWSAGFRLATGNLNDPVSTNQTLGTAFNKFSVLFDRAYLKFDPYPWLSIAGGRIPNPWFGSDLVWDEDLNFEGVAASASRQFATDLKGHFTLGAFPLQEVELSSKDKWLFGAQGIVDWEGDSRYKARVGLGLYEYRNVAGIANTTPGSTLNNFSAPQFRQKGNSVFNIDADGDPNTNLFALAADFREVNLTTSLTMSHFDPLIVNVTGDIVKNIGFDQSKIRDRTGLSVDEKTLGYQARVSVGHQQVRERNDWQVFAAYRHLERDAVLDAYTDSDFNLGGTNAKGFVLGGSYGIDKNAWLTARWFSADEIDGPPLGIDTLFIDLNVKF